MQSKILDHIAVNEAKSTMKAKYPLMIEYFLEDSQTYIENIKNAIASNQIEQIVAHAHALKSSARQMGAIRMSDISRTMEELGREHIIRKQRNFTPFIEAIPKLEAAFADTKLALHKPTHG